MSNEYLPHDPDFRPAVGGPVERMVRANPRRPGFMETLERAALLLEGEAAAMKECHTLRGRWTRDQYSDVAKAAFEDMTATATALRAAHKYMRVNPLGGPAKVFDACADSIRAGEPMDAAMAHFGIAWAP